MTDPISVPNLPPLSIGSINKILNEEIIDHAILQILGYKRVPGSQTERFRLLLNDGETLFPFALLGTQLNHLIESKKLEKFTILKLNKFACTDLPQNKKVILCLEIETLVPGSVVGNQVFPSTQAISSEFQSSRFQNTSITEETMHNCSSDTFNQPSTSGVSFSSNIKKPISLTNNSLNCRSESSSIISNSSVYNPNWDTLKSLTDTEATYQSNIPIVPIINLTPYQKKWIVKARIVYKKSLRNYNNVKGAGKFFAFYLIDDSGEIRVTTFNEQAELLYDFLEVDKVYYISNAKIQLAMKNSPIKNDFEMQLCNNSKIELASDHSDVPRLEFEFVPIKLIPSLPKESFVDVIGVCCCVSDMKTIVTKANKELGERDLILIDTDKRPITVSLWGTDAEEFKSQDNHVILIKRAKIIDFRGCSLTVTQDTMLFIDPPVSEATILKSWFESLNDSVNVKSVPSVTFNEFKSLNWKTFADITAIDFEDSDRTEYFTVKACIDLVQKEKCMYKSCPLEDCFKKVIDLNNGFYKCIKCDKEYNSFTWVLLLSLNLADFSGSLWVVAFKEIAEILIGHEVKILSKVKMENEDQYLNILSNMHFKSFIFKLRSKMEVFNEIKRLKTIVLEVKHVDPVLYTKKLLSDIYRMRKILNLESVSCPN
ncbi:replication protein A 70 kDa DNA-binding subunit [Trichonephila inaurata madagascariensis]|uniref:Replication protein A subunit n=1 Tax=Trichonephila inaurata madagascariensis TaxID=2747483 RepID=A0A8X6JXN0_9ARAC|nr:replication protein A 70 kDa DNA-binding subunit [Trichonephila inaurata madagascariensis]